MTPLQLATLFHETYERMAPTYGYATRPETRVFDPTSPNGLLMIAVCDEMLKAFDADLKNHELLDRSYLVAELFNQEIAQHPAAEHPKLAEHIERVEASLYELYQKIGSLPSE